MMNITCFLSEAEASGLTQEGCHIIPLCTICTRYRKYEWRQWQATGLRPRDSDVLELPHGNILPADNVVMIPRVAVLIVRGPCLYKRGGGQLTLSSAYPVYLRRISTSCFDHIPQIDEIVNEEAVRNKLVDCWHKVLNLETKFFAQRVD
jgi:hypothetical protein